MDKKKILLIGGALLLGTVLLSQRQPQFVGGGGVGTVREAITGLTVTQDEGTKKEAAVAGGDVYYNITFPEAAGITFPTIDFTGGGGSGGADTTPTQLTETKKTRTVKEIAAGVADPSAPGIIPSATKKEAAKEIIGRPPSTGIAILDKIAFAAPTPEPLKMFFTSRNVATKRSPLIFGGKIW